MAKRVYANYSPVQHLTLLVVRLVVAFFMISGHGYSKLQKLLAAGDIEFANPFGIGAGITLSLTVFAEVVCSVLIGLGLFTRLATVPLIITMAVAAFVIHADDPLRKMESAIIYLIIYLFIAAFGAGKYSVDRLKR